MTSMRIERLGGRFNGTADAVACPSGGRRILEIERQGQELNPSSGSPP